MFVDPRRPVTVTPEMREEGVIPYMPELPIPTESIINYNKSLPQINGIHTAPSGLESTSLVLVHGLGKLELWKRRTLFQFFIYCNTFLLFYIFVFRSILHQGSTFQNI